jgi:pilus assembly protein CpaC
MAMLNLAASLAIAIAVLQCALAERASKNDAPVPEMRLISSDANARLLTVGLNKAMAIDLTADIKEVLVADSQTVRVIVRTVRRFYIVGATVGRTNVFFYGDDDRQLVALDISVSPQMPPSELRVPVWQQPIQNVAAL